MSAAAPPAARIWCVVPAAGSGSRFGAEKPKQYMDLDGKPLILVTLERLCAHPAVAGVVVALAPDDRWWPGLGEVSGRPLWTVTGGATRAESVLAAVRGLPSSVGPEAWVAVHDAARPCVALGDLDRLFSFCFQSGLPALLAVPVRETVKRVGADARVESTVPRENLWKAQTPQCAPRGLLERALVANLEKASRGLGRTATDESNALEEINATVCLVEGSESNLKVTTAPDLDLARFWIQRDRGAPD